MNAADLERRLEKDRIVRLTAREWRALEGSFEELERHDTAVAGDLVIVATGAGIVAVERPAPGRRVLRRLEDEVHARQFVKERLELYDRMWDGCGCRVDYYS